MTVWRTPELWRGSPMYRRLVTPDNESGAVVCIEGLAGMGKSALLASVAADTKGLVLRLSGRTGPSGLLAAALTALGERGQGGEQIVPTWKPGMTADSGRLAWQHVLRHCGEHHLAVTLILDDVHLITSSVLRMMRDELDRAWQRTGVEGRLVGAGLPGSSDLLDAADWTVTSVEPLAMWPEAKSREVLASFGIDDVLATEELVTVTQGWPVAVLRGADMLIKMRPHRSEPGWGSTVLAATLFDTYLKWCDERELHYLTALHRLGGQAGSGALAATAGYRRGMSAGVVRHRLIECGLVFSRRHGELETALPRWAFGPNSS